MPVGWKWRFALALVGIALWSHPGVAAKIERFKEKDGTLHIRNAEPEPVQPGGATASNPPAAGVAPRISPQAAPPQPVAPPPEQAAPLIPEPPEEAPPVMGPEPNEEPLAEPPAPEAGNNPADSLAQTEPHAASPQRGPAPPPFDRRKIPGFRPGPGDRGQPAGP